MAAPSESSFSALLASAQAGSTDALGELMETVRPQLSAFLRQRVGAGMRRHLSTADLEQDVLLGAGDLVQHLAADAQPSDLQALVLRHAHWAIGKASRRNQNLVGESAMPEDGAECAESVPTTGFVTTADELARVEELLGDMPAELADVVRLRGQEMTFEVIGETLGIGADAARKRFLRAARLMRGRLQD